MPAKFLQSVLGPLREASRAVKWVALILPVAGLIGSAVAFFLWSLDWVTAQRFAHPWLLWYLPAGGLVVGLVYHWLGRSAEGGTNLVMDEIHQPSGGVPARMAPLILLGTLLTHLFGGSAGREGTAVQMGGSLAAFCGKHLRLDAVTLRILLMCGIAAGFGAVFGTPLAGAVFALEVLTLGKVEYAALLPCFVAALAGDWTCHAWGIGHTHYAIRFELPPGVFHLSPILFGKVLVASVAFGLCSRFFSEFVHRVHGLFKHWIAFAPLRPVVGGGLVIGLVYLLGTRDYLGLGITSPWPNAVTISSFFTSPEIHPWAWWWKILFTVVTLGSGFKGGEVTPLFFIGAALGNALSGLLHAPPDLLAGLGFVAIFAGATNTPLACTLMGVELFGSDHVIYIATACFIAYLCSGHSGIYLSQRIGVAKDGRQLSPGHTALRDLR